MASRYWVGGTDTWDATAGSKWALTSGGAGGQAVPTSSDTVFFDANSGANTITLGANANCSTLTMTGFTGTLAFSTFKISVAGNNTTIFTGATTYSITGTKLIELTYSGSVGTRICATGATSEANSISINVIAGTDIVNSGGFNTNCDYTGFSGSSTIGGKQLYGNLTLSTGMTVLSTTNPLICAATSLTQLITTNGKALDNPVTFNGVGGTVQLQDAMTVGSTRIVTLTNGTLNLNNKNLTCGFFSSSNSNIRSLIMGSSTVTLTNTGTTNTLWNIATSTNMTLSAGTSTITLVSIGVSTATTRFWQGGGLTYNNLTLPGDVNCTIYIYGTNTFNNVTANGPGSVGRFTVVWVNNNTVTGTLSSTSAAVNQRSFWCVVQNTAVTSSTITAGTVNLSNIDFRNITAAGASAPWSGPGFANGGNNSGITFPAAKTVYWNNAAGGNWTDANWAAVSGGSTSISNLPLAQDTAVLNNAGTANGITISWPGNWSIGTFNCATLTNSVTMNESTSAGSLDFFGEIILSNSMTIATAGSSWLTNSTTSNITSAGVTLTCFNLVTQAVAGGYTRLVDDLRVSGNISALANTLNLNGRTLTVSGNFSVQGPANSITFNGGAINVGNNWTNNNTLRTFSTSAGTGAGTIYMSSGSAKTFAGGSYSYAATLVQAGSGDLTITGNNTFNNITNTVRPAAIYFAGGNTTTLTSGFGLSGTLGFPVTINSTNTTPYTLSLASGSVTVRNMNISYSTAAGGATWNAVNSTDGGNNSGWSFSNSGQTVIFGPGITLGGGITFS